MTECPLCAIPGAETRLLDKEQVVRATCPRCGTFEVEGMAVRAYRDRGIASVEANRYLLSGRARTESDEGRVVRFTMADLGDAEHGRIQPKTLQEMIILMLRWFSNKSPAHGHWLSPVSARDYPAAYCKTESEWTTLIHDLTQKGLLRSRGQEFRITLDGQDALAKADDAQQPRRSGVTDVPKDPARSQACANTMAVIDRARAQEREDADRERRRIDVETQRRQLDALQSEMERTRQSQEAVPRDRDDPRRGKKP